MSEPADNFALAARHPEKYRASERIVDDVSAYLARGNRIQRVPVGVCGWGGAKGKRNQLVLRAPRAREEERRAAAAAETRRSRPVLRAALRAAAAFAGVDCEEALGAKAAGWAGRGGARARRLLALATDKESDPALAELFGVDRKSTTTRWRSVARKVASEDPAFSLAAARIAEAIPDIEALDGLFRKWSEGGTAEHARERELDALYAKVAPRAAELSLVPVEALRGVGGQLTRSPAHRQVHAARRTLALALRHLGATYKEIGRLMASSAREARRRIGTGQQSDVESRNAESIASEISQ